MEKIKVLSLCDGISCGYMALKKLGIEFEYHAVEIDKFPRAISDDNFKDIIRWENDVNNISRADILKNGPYDLTMFGSPCQSVSVAGNNKGLDGKSGLLLKCLEVLKMCHEANPGISFLIENVKMKKEFLNQFNELIGSTPVLINSSLISAQKRERYYWTNFPITQPENRNIAISQILEDGQLFGWSKSTRYKMESGKISSLKKESVGSYVEQRLTADMANTLTTGDGCGNQSTCNYVVQINQSREAGGRQPFMQNRIYHPNGKSISLTACFASRLKIGTDELHYRKLTVRECARLQTIPDNIKFDSVSNNQAFRGIGNGWTVDVIAHILKHLSISVMQ